MMFGAVVGCVVVVAGCYAPATPSGLPCSPQRRCPSPFECTAGVCEAPGDGRPRDSEADGPVIDGPRADAMLVCPPDFLATPFGSCHRPGTSSAAWPAAEAACESLGAHLVVVETVAEAMVLPNPSWIGLSDRVTERSYRLVTGPEASFLYFDGGAPQGAELRDCVHVALGDERWAEGPCDFRFPYTCEYDGVPVDPGAY